MCASCGCVLAGTGTPDDDHGDARNVTLPDLEAAAAVAGITTQQAAQNITDTLAATQKTGAHMIRTAPTGELIRKTISAPAASFKFDDGEEGVAEALVSTTNALDSQGDIIEPGAYGKMIAAWKAAQVDAPARCQDHDWGCVTGFTTDMEELLPGDPRLPAEFRDKGWGALWVKYRYILDSDDGRNAYAKARARYKARAGGQHSVGFLIDEDSEAEGKAVEWKGPNRHIKRIFPLVEHSDVLLGAAPRTQTTRLKSQFVAPAGCTCPGFVVEGCPAAEHVALAGVVGVVSRADYERYGGLPWRERSAWRLGRARVMVADLKATWSTAYQNDLPDDAFAFVGNGGEKEAIDGKTFTKPRSLRHFPHHDKNGDPDEAHVRNALARIPQSSLSAADQGKALAHVKGHASSLGIEVSEDGKAAVVDAAKSTTHSHFHIHPDGEAHSHNHTHAGDVTDHDGPGTKVPHAHGHDGAPKGAESGEAKGMPLPELTGEEAVHADALASALASINALIEQELAEDGCTEYGDVISLCFVAQDLLCWARGEASEYSDALPGGISAWDLWAAGREALLAKQAVSAAPEPAVDPLLDAMSKLDMSALIRDAATEAVRPSPRHDVPDTSDGSDDLMHFARHAWHR